LSAHWRAGRAGALRLGLLHGLYCVGCCAVLMALLFVGGVMNLLWIVPVALFVLVEKCLPGGERMGKAGGGLLIAWGAAAFFIAA
jgi:predicted metal-binding membrane protein